MNGNWERGLGRIPSLVAEVRGVKLEEMGSWGGGAGAGTVGQVPPWASPARSDSGLGPEHSPERNSLSWLLNFRLEQLPGLAEVGAALVTTAAAGPTPGSQQQQQQQQVTAQHREHVVGAVATREPPAHHRHHGRHAITLPPLAAAAVPGSSSSSTAQCYSVPPGARKPPFTYTELIEHALREKGELTVSGIYQWIS